MGASADTRLNAVLERLLEMGRAQVHENEIDIKIRCIKAMLSELGDDATQATERSRLREQLYKLYLQAIEDTGGGCHASGGGHGPAEADTGNGGGGGVGGGAGGYAT
jgi:hypothetical protein